MAADASLRLRINTDQFRVRRHPSLADRLSSYSRAVAAVPPRHLVHPLILTIAIVVAAAAVV